MASLAVGNCETQLKTIKTSGGLAPEKRHRFLLVPYTFMSLQSPTSFDCFNHKVLLKGPGRKFMKNPICSIQNYPLIYQFKNDFFLHLTVSHYRRLPIISARFLAFHQKLAAFIHFPCHFSWTTPRFSLNLHRLNLSSRSGTAPAGQKLPSWRAAAVLSLRSRSGFTLR